MKLTKSDFMLMRWNIVALCGSLLISATGVYLSDKYADRTKKDRRAVQNQLNDARHRLNTAKEDQKNMAIYSDEYRSLLERKIIGDDHRLDWMEGLENMRQQNLVRDFRYSISPQKTFAPQPAMDSGNFDIHYSEMRLQFDLLHEGQLLGFFDTLRREIKGNYQVEGCTLKTLGGDNRQAAGSSETHLKAECSGGWITLKNRNAPQ